MRIFHLILYKNPQTLQDLDDYQVKNFSCHIEVLKEEEQSASYDFKLEDTEEIGRLMRQPPRHQERVK